MKQLAGPYKIDKALLKQMCLECLSHNVGQIFSVLGKSITLGNLAYITDKGMDIYPDSHNLNIVQANGRADTSSLGTFQQQLAELSNKLALLQATKSTVHYRRAGSMSRRKSFSRQHSRSRKRISEICWYHQKYDIDARSCTRMWTFIVFNDENQIN